MKATRCIALALLLCSTLAPALAQSPTGTIGGRVADARGDVVVGATVVVANAETGLRRETETDDEGIFAVALLPPGRYTATVSREGFKTAEVVDVDLRAGERQTLEIALTAGAIAESVTIEGTSLVETESAAVGARIERKLLENLPLSGRSLTSLFTLAPGVVATNGGPGQFSVNGQRTNANSFTVDGVSTNFALSGSNLALSVFGGTNSLVSIDAVQEVAILTSTYAPEYGRTSGGQVAVVTRSGTNDFHGSVFEYLRNEALDATDWFVNRDLKGEKPPLRSNQFGAVLGGPILRGRTFFFFSYEGQRLLLGRFGTWQVPSIAVRESVPEWMRSFVNAFPVPTGTEDVNGLSEFTAGVSEPWTLDATSIRVDHTLGERVTLFGRYSYAPSNRTDRGSNVYSANNVFYTSGNARTLTLGVTQVFGPRVANELRVNVSTLEISGRFAIDDFGGAVPVSDDELFFGDFTPSNTIRDISMVVPRGVIGPTYSVGTPTKRVPRQLNLVDHVSVAAGAHQLRLGGDYRRLSSRPQNFSYGVGTSFDFANPPATPMVNTFLEVVGGGRNTSQVTENLSLYAQDTWRATPRLTLTYGLRWEVNFPAEDETGDGALVVVGADDPATLRLAPAGTERRNGTYGSIALRFGGAYELSQARGRETVLRAGWGIFYDLGAGNSGFLTGLLSQRDLGQLPYPLDPALLISAPGRPIPPIEGLIAVDENLVQPRTVEASVTLEQALGVDQTLSVSYVGAFGRKLLSRERFGYSSPIFPGVSSVDIIRNGARSDYNALQVHFQRRVTAGLGALASYTWSYATDTVSSDLTAVRASELPSPGLVHGAASFDVRHNLAAAVTYDVPSPSEGGVGRAVLGNWSTDWVLRARSAFPIDVGSIPFFSPIVRASLVPGQPIYVDDPLAPGGRRLNRAAFVVPASGQGSLGRNELRGFPAWQIDVSLRRRFALTERVELQFRAEVFNVLNHPNFADPVGNLNSGLFGVAPAMLATALGGLSPNFAPAMNLSQSAYQFGGPRAFQFGLKLQF